MLFSLRFYFFSKKVLTFTIRNDIMYRQVWENTVANAGMAELADARDLKSREIFSRTGSTPASGTIISRSGAVWQLVGLITRRS